MTELQQLDPLVWAGVAAVTAWAVALAIYLVSHNITIAPKQPRINVRSSERRSDIALVDVDAKGQPRPAFMPKPKITFTKGSFKPVTR